jgi:hypothetical protein
MNQTNIVFFWLFWFVSVEYFVYRIHFPPHSSGGDTAGTTLSMSDQRTAWNCKKKLVLYC